MNRRDMLRSGLTAGAGLAAMTQRAAADPVDLSFPRDFRWGCATAAYQIEGAVREDGRGQTNWDVFSHTPGKVANNDTGDIACDSYHRYADDIALLKGRGSTATVCRSPGRGSSPTGAARRTPRASTITTG